ncbi:hypothetical protein BGY98DRAFT_941307 [Russula aff. rugulosa BPL654]|nr:hypothetical protein BGY98DRAFT_941307 [Russula aff. rugulosa BPL654]
MAAPSAGPTVPVPRYEEEEEDSDEDVYAPELPPDLAAARANANANANANATSSSSVPPAARRRPIGPARGPLQREEEEEGSEDEIGPAPPPLSSSHVHEDAVIDFMQKEAQRRQAIEFLVLVPLCASGFSSAIRALALAHVYMCMRVYQCHSLTYASPLQEAARPKTLKRDEWMLSRPHPLDPTKLNKPRQFSRSTATPKTVDNSLWTETPAERQQRLADEVMGKKRRVENADLDQEGDEEDAGAGADGAKRRKREAELQRQVEEYTRSHRGPSLLKAHAQEDAKRKKDTQEESAGIWDHSRDMGVGGRLMDEKDRRRAIQDAKGLSDRFGAGKGGSFL